MLHDVLFHHFIIELKRVFKSEAVLDLSTFGFDDKRTFRVNSVFNVVFLSSLHYVLKLALMSPTRILLADQTFSWRSMFALTAIKFTHDLIKFVHFQISGLKWLLLDIFIFATRHLKCSFKLHCKFRLHFIKSHTSTGPFIITTKLALSLCGLLCWFSPSLESYCSFICCSFSWSRRSFCCRFGSTKILIFHFLFYFLTNYCRQFFFFTFLI